MISPVLFHSLAPRSLSFCLSLTPFPLCPSLSFLLSLSHTRPSLSLFFSLFLRSLSPALDRLWSNGRSGFFFLVVVAVIEGKRAASLLCFHSRCQDGSESISPNKQEVLRSMSTDQVLMLQNTTECRSICSAHLLNGERLRSDRDLSRSKKD